MKKDQNHLESKKFSIFDSMSRAKKFSTSVLLTKNSNSITSWPGFCHIIISQEEEKQKRITHNGSFDFDLFYIDSYLYVF